MLGLGFLSGEISTESYVSVLRSIDSASFLIISAQAEYPVFRFESVSISTSRERKSISLESSKSHHQSAHMRYDLQT